METIDVVYVLGTGSNWSNNEIRFSLRAIEQNLKGTGNVYIVGEFPKFLHNAIHIQYPDEFGPANADGNIIRKVLRVIEEKRLSRRFLFINDDHMIMKPIKAADVPYFHKGDLNTYKDHYFKSNYWRKRLGRTRDVLNFKHQTAFHYDCHTPFLIDKTLFPDIVEFFDYGVNPGYTMKSIYANSAKVPGVLLTDQKKTIFEHYTRAQLDERLKDCTFMSYNDGGLNHEFKIWLIEHFPEMSRFELTDYDDVFWNIALALRTPNNKELIRHTFIKYGRERNLVNMVQHTYTDQLHEKILYKLRHLVP